MQYPEYGRRFRAERAEAFKAWLAFIKDAPCTDCGGRFPPVAMDFDHVRGQKRCDITSMAFHNKRGVCEEMLKCELVCANCHRVRTHGVAE